VASLDNRYLDKGARQTQISGEAERVINHRRERRRHLRQGKRLSNGTVVVTEYDASGRLVRETHYTSDKAWVTKIIEGGSKETDLPDAS
jgi:YD repeat-containing protein